MNQIPREPRKSFMLAATIEASGVSLPVRIRNMASRGAMVDGSYLPAPGTAVVLSRLSLKVSGTVVWRLEGRCGLELADQVVPDEWVAGVCAGVPRTNFGQARVDGIQKALRQGAEMLAASPSESPPQGIDRDRLDSLIAAEIDQVARALEEALDELSENPDVLARHERALQSVDIACAILDSLSPVLRAADRGKAVEAVAMHEVRSRLSGRPTLT
ncbi:MAG: hypothetical protein ACO1OD_13180 [Croceibacterium sp.]